MLQGDSLRWLSGQMEYPPKSSALVLVFKAYLIRVAFYMRIDASA